MKKITILMSLFLVSLSSCSNPRLSKDDRHSDRHDDRHHDRHDDDRDDDDDHRYWWN